MFLGREKYLLTNAQRLLNENLGPELQLMRCFFGWSLAEVWFYYLLALQLNNTVSVQYKQCWLVKSADVTEGSNRRFSFWEVNKPKTACR